jgi:competence ComEA-like helix-hairpin-helix protein
MRRALLSLCLTAWVCGPVAVRAQGPGPVPGKVPVLLDTDLGTAIDDAFALAFVLASPELDLRGITTVHGDAHTRALIACRFLHAVGRDDIPVASGSPAREQPEAAGQFQYGLRPSVKRPEREPAVEFLYSQLRARPNEYTLLALGPLTNLGELLTRHPDCKPWIKRIVLMGGALRVGYDEKASVDAEWNVRTDVRSAQAVFASGVPLVVAPLDATAGVKLEEPLRSRVLRAQTPATQQVRILYDLAGQPLPTLFDPVAVALSFEERFCAMADLRLEVDARGFTRTAPGKPNARVATSIRRQEFLNWFVDRLTRNPPEPVVPGKKPAGGGKAAKLRGQIDINRAGYEELQRLPGIGTKLAERIIQERRTSPFKAVDDLRRVRGIGRKTLEKVLPYVTVFSEPADEAARVQPGGMPNRVHVLEDFDTDLARQRWLCGKPETTNVPPGSRRSCRGGLTNDFDDRLGDPAALYTAVVLKPAPSPAVGRNPRLSLRYWLKGTTSLRVQIESLTRGHHRNLSLTDLPQERWQPVTLDLTVARRQDGGGDALAQGEQVGAIQFYADAGAELLIDDLVLYDAAAPGETRPFPRRLLFTGWFDAGRQGKDWPGDFEIVTAPPPRSGMVARSVPNAERGTPWIRLSLRGERPLGEKTALRFGYHLSGAQTVRVMLVGRAIPKAPVIEMKDLAVNQWAEATCDVLTNWPREVQNAAGPAQRGCVEEIQFLLPRGAELLLSDVLLYEPASPAKPSPDG